MTILIAEDDPITLEGISSSLEKEGFTVIATENGRQAVEQWETSKPDLICLDIMMPEMDGFEACRLIRTRDSEIPILFLSAKNEETDVVTGLDLGADDFIRKPFGKKELLARIRSAIRRIPHGKTGRRSFQISDLIVFPRELRAERNGDSIELSPREIGILILLKERQSEVVTRDELLGRCWGVSYFPDSRTLDQHISLLRKRIETDRDSPKIIETVRGVGYRYRG
ncbi:MAG: two-component system alkaline phosphatase synthesis response regulator PhoP [Verrucomicrobiales bacterium]|jgi:two-component system alkaline phosphatase synthesis response regulator PhoP